MRCCAKDGRHWTWIDFKCWNVSVQYIDKGIEGGVSYIAQRYNKTNNKRLEFYDKNKMSNCIIYEDTNNLSR